MADELPKVFMNKDNKANFTCPVCKKARLVDVSEYKNIDKAVKVKCKCPCGNRYSVLLERRKFVRKQVSFIGSYIAIEKGLDVKGRMTVVDLSRTGLRFKMHMQNYFEKGDLLEMEFTLDDNEQTTVKKEVQVMSQHGMYVGARFTSEHHYDRLGTYLLYKVG
ncbi:MAG: PilZ domain-containing protein [Thermodesulfobacteriota bacterium]|nr:PilZ domain-containing protein [Thermodesulfobacteriota bacterium]